jgi:hypothetical protein
MRAVTLRRAVETNRDYPNSHFWLSAAPAHSGRIGEARAVAQEGLKRLSSTRPSQLRGNGLPRGVDNPTYLAQCECLFDGLRKPECQRASASKQPARRVVCLCLFQIERAIPFGERPVDRSEKLTGLIPFALV